MYRAFVKRAFDALLAASSLLVASPIFLLAALAIILEDGRPVIFTQTRVGRDGRPFRIFKFRSMRVGVGDLPSDKAGGLTVTRVGAILRRTNVDEIPQLINIVLGDMSIVGPRPALPAQESLTALRRENGALSCRPGLTGLAQISSYDGMPEAEKAVFDGRYAGRITLLGDLLLIGKTFGYLAHRPPTY